MHLFACFAIAGFLLLILTILCNGAKALHDAGVNQPEAIGTLFGISLYAIGCLFLLTFLV